MVQRGRRMALARGQRVDRVEQVDRTVHQRAVEVEQHQRRDIFDHGRHSFTAQAR